MNLTVVIQAGGQSNRMGQNKALMPFLGQPLIQRVYERLAPVAQEVLVTVQETQGLEFLGLPLIEDRIKGRGALGGLYTALVASSNPLVAVAACDMPFANPVLLAAQAKILVAENADVVIPSSQAGLEPLHAVYRRDACLSAVRSALDANLHRLISWFPSVNVRILPVEEVQIYDPELRAFINVNTLEEFRSAEIMAIQDRL
jgi:molybdopterin-guanine dinucleotide biosynthesis protein A